MLMLGPFGLFISAGSWLLAGRRYRYAAFSAAVGLLTLFVAAWALIPALGPAGVFLSAAAAQFIAAMTRLIPLLRTEPQAFGIPTRNAFAVATAAAALYGTWAWAGWPVIPGCLLALGVLALGAFRWCLRQPERQLVLAVLTRRQAS
jgi:hypothetical protein